MGSKKSAAGLEAERLCRLFPDTPSRTLAKRIAVEYKTTVEAARTLIRKARGNCGQEGVATSPRKNGKAGWKPQCPESLAEPWTPFELDGVKLVGVLSDTHIPYHSQMALSVAVEYLKKRKPDCLLLNGDYCDFYAVSRWEKNPKLRNFKVEHKLLLESLEWLRHEFPKIRIVFKKGNHEERWDKYLWNHAAEISDLEFLKLEHWLEFEKHGIEMVEEQRPIMAGELPIFHGHELPRGMASPVNPARGAYLRTAHTVLVGHGHRTSGHAESDLWHEEVFCWSTGCLCDMRPEYARINKWNHGFAVVDISNDGSFGVQNLRITSDGQVRSS